MPRQGGCLILRLELQLSSVNQGLITSQQKRPKSPSFNVNQWLFSNLIRLT